MTAAGAVRIGQAALLAAAAATGVAYFEFGRLEVAVAILGGSALAASAELALDRGARETAPAWPAAEPARWSLPELERAAQARDRGTLRDQQRAYLLGKLAPFADELGYVPPDLADLVRESLPELVG